MKALLIESLPCWSRSFVCSRRSITFFHHFQTISRCQDFGELGSPEFRQASAAPKTYSDQHRRRGKGTVDCRDFGQLRGCHCDTKTAKPCHCSASYRCSATDESLRFSGTNKRFVLFVTVPHFHFGTLSKLKTHHHHTDH